MKFLFYSTDSNFYNGKTFHYSYNPSCKKQFEDLVTACPDFDFVVVSNKPGLFLLDLADGELTENNKCSKVKYIVTEESDIEKLVKIISSENPDYAIPFTGFYKPFDYQGFKDSMIAEELNKNGIKTFCNSLKTQQICFDKNETQKFLESEKFNVPKSLYVHHDLFWAERNHKEVKENLYKNKVFYELKKLKLPLIIKDTTGLSSYGMEVVTTYNQAKAFLESKKNNGDKLIQELIEGTQFGVEIYGCKGNYTISKPFMFSVNQYKITSPKQSIKTGPVNNSRYNFSLLKTELNRLAESLEISGAAQVDLVFKDSQWYIIEINPRLSGMTASVMTSMRTNILKMMTAKALGKTAVGEENPILSIKLPVLNNSEIIELQKFSWIKVINQIQNDEAKQEREKGYCEIIISDNYKNIELHLLELKNKYPEFIDEGFYKQALEMTGLIDN